MESVVGSSNPNELEKERVRTDNLRHGDRAV